MATLSSPFSSPFPFVLLPNSKPISSNRLKNFKFAAATDKPPKISTSAGEKAEVRLSPNVNGATVKIANVETVEVVNGLRVLYEDGFGRVSVKDYFAAAKEVLRPDGGPPRWFCHVECGKPIENAPVLFFLPGVDGTGMGLIMHHKSLGKVFEVRCLHIPVNDRTSFEGLVKFVEYSVTCEHAVSPNKPIYLLGDSFGGCLALSVAARNPCIDLVLILVNPATSFRKSPMQPFLPLLEALPGDFHSTLPYMLSFIMGDPVKMPMANVGEDLSPPQTLQELSESLTSLLPLLSDFNEILPKETFLWKLMLLKTGATYANSRLHAVEAEVLLLASGNDNLLPSGEEADRLWSKLKNCRVRYFKDSGHTLLLEDGFNLLTIIKRTSMYRRSKKHNFVTDYLPPTISEYRKHCVEDNRLYRLATSAVMFSTLSNGRIVKGLEGVPDEGPVILVGYHMLMGFELEPLFEAFLREKNILIRAMAHPALFRIPETSRQELSLFELIPMFGALPVSPINMYRMLSNNSFILLYPGGTREALHRKRVVDLRLL